ncbi:M20/M25/M40 family metallo-hydrolase [Patescibacteria group bacterium]|nr:M20/M25/M40 family metallo-hydrolase [Patescibacteria group bacterium]
MIDNLNAYLRDAIKFKNDLDEIAEISWQEKKTKNYIIKKLGEDYHWSKRTALIYKIGNGIPIFFRTETDALGTDSGPKHVCGHSSHTAALMAAYLYFKENPIAGVKLYFIFQPSEEGYPSGAKFISDNAKDIKECRAGFAFHVFPGYEKGILINPVFASADFFEINIYGKPTHIKNKNADYKHDAILAASKVVAEINSKLEDNWIINIGTIKGGESANKIAGTVYLTGDIRALTGVSRLCGKRFLERTCFEIQEANKGIKIKLTYHRGYPILKNDQKLLKKVKKIFNIKADIRSFAAEDFSLYPAPKIFLLIGTGNNKELHTNEFEVDGDLIGFIFYNWIVLGKNLINIFNV